MQRRKCQRKCKEGRKSDVSWPRNKLHFLAQVLRWCKSSPHSFSVAIPLHQHFQLDWLSAFSRSDNSQSYTSPKAILLTAECWSLPSNTAFVPISALGWLWMQTEATKWCHCWKLGWGERHTWAGLVSIVLSNVVWKIAFPQIIGGIILNLKSAAAFDSARSSPVMASSSLLLLAQKITVWKSSPATKML